MYDSQSQKDLFDRSKIHLNDKSSLDPENAIQELIEVIRFHEWKYYVQNDPVISDYEYDMLYKKLKALEQANPQLLSADSPTQRVSSDLTSEFPTVPHIIPMLSLDNSYNLEDLEKFDTQVK